MGCDIHLRAEVRIDGSWQPAGRAFDSERDHGPYESATRETLESLSDGQLLDALAWEGRSLEQRIGRRPAMPADTLVCGGLLLATWECGHVEIDDGSTHECDGRDVCSATYTWHALPPRMLAEFHEHPNALGEGTNTQTLRRVLHQEEHAELMHELEEAAAGRPNLEQIARELADVIYVTYGSAWAFGIDLDAALREVHRAAMDKMNAGLRREDGKILKPPGFQPPSMAQAARDAS